MLIQGLGCDFQNEAAITASIQMQLDLTFHARRELPFQVPANQMDGVPTVHTFPTSSGPAWVGPFSSPQHAIRPGEKLFNLEHSGFSLPSLAFLAHSQSFRAKQADIFSLWLARASRLGGIKRIESSQFGLFGGHMPPCYTNPILTLDRFIACRPAAAWPMF